MSKDILSDEDIKLKPCPFCGSFADCSDAPYTRNRQIIIGCTNPFCFCQIKYKISITAAPYKVIKITRQLAERWNKRIIKGDTV